MTVSNYDEWCTGAVNLVDYCNIVGFWECAFFGVNYADDVEQGCRTIWLRWQRDMVARYLCEAQEEVEDELNYPVEPKWFTSEHHDYTIPIVTKWGEVISGGVRGETTIQANAAVDLTVEPAEVGPIATTVTDEDEIKIFYPGTDLEIIASSITIAGGNVTIEIPRCRIVEYSLLDTPATGIDYTVDANFQDPVDVRRVYNDGSTQATLVDPHRCSSGCLASNCSEYTHSGCIYVKFGQEGIVDSVPATYSGGAWTDASCTRRYSVARLNYYAGLTNITRKLQDAIIRLAHSKMPQDPCGCDPIKYLWIRDRNVPDNITIEQLNCPFGSSDGAWWAWKQVQSVRLVKAGLVY